MIFKYYPRGFMFDSKKIDDIVKRLSETLPAGVKDIKQDLEKNFRAILQSTLAKMDLVTREEFDAQVGVLKRSREKLQILEKKLAAIEKPKKTK